VVRLGKVKRGKDGRWYRFKTKFLDFSFSSVDRRYAQSHWGLKDFIVKFELVSFKKSAKGNLGD